MALYNIFCRRYPFGGGQHGKTWRNYNRLQKVCWFSSRADVIVTEETQWVFSTKYVLDLCESFRFVCTVSTGMRDKVIIVCVLCYARKPIFLKIYSKN